MSSVLHPVGPERRGTYWRRRLVLIAVLVVLVVLAVLGIRALAGGGTDGTGVATTTLDPNQVSPAPVSSSGTSTADPTGSPMAGGSPTAATSQASVGPCADSALKVVLTTDAPSYGPAGAPKFVVTVVNTSETTCSAEIGSAERTFTVTDPTGAVVWRSGDCQTETASQVYDIAPQDHQAMSLTWSRQRSEAGCPANQTRVDPGAYTVNATWKDVTAPPVQFSITG